MRQKYRRMKDQKPQPGFARNQDFANGERLQANVKK